MLITLIIWFSSYVYPCTMNDSQVVAVFPLVVCGCNAGKVPEDIKSFQEKFSQTDHLLLHTTSNTLTPPALLWMWKSVHAIVRPLLGSVFLRSQPWWGVCTGCAHLPAPLGCFKIDFASSPSCPPLIFTKRGALGLLCELFLAHRRQAHNPIETK